jgi:hypothetical protein
MRGAFRRVIGDASCPNYRDSWTDASGPKEEHAAARCLHFQFGMVCEAEDDHATQSFSTKFVATSRKRLKEDDYSRKKKVQVDIL